MSKVILVVLFALSSSCKTADSNRSTVSSIQSEDRPACALYEYGTDIVRTTYDPKEPDAKSQCLADQEAVNILASNPPEVDCRCKIAGNPEPKKEEGCVTVNSNTGEVVGTYEIQERDKCLVDQRAMSILGDRVECQCGNEISKCRLVVHATGKPVQVYSNGSFQKCAVDQRATNTLVAPSERVECHGCETIPAKCVLKHAKGGRIEREYNPPNRSACIADAKALKILDKGDFICDCN